MSRLTCGECAFRRPCLILQEQRAPLYKSRNRNVSLLLAETAAIRKYKMAQGKLRVMHATKCCKQAYYIDGRAIKSPENKEEVEDRRYANVDKFDEQRKREPHHLPNVWKESYVQSLQSPFSAEAYTEHAKSLIWKIRECLRYQVFQGQVKSCEEHLVARLSLVDCLQSLGISRHFELEIMHLLHSAYIIWKDCQTGVGDRLSIEASALAFRMLRLHRFPDVSPETLLGTEGFGMQEKQKAFKVEFIKEALAVLKASRIQFPGELALEQAEYNASNFLDSFLSCPSSLSSLPKYLVMEVKHVMEYPWYESPPRWEVRCYIDIYSANTEWLSSSHLNRTLLELAILDYNILQSQQQCEIQSLFKWWSGTEVSKLNIFRQRPVECYFLIASGMFEEEFQQARMAVAKATQTVFVLDDIYDNYASLQEAFLFTQAFTCWDSSSVKSVALPKAIKTCFRFLMDTYTHLIYQCNNATPEGRDAQPLLKCRWVEQAKSFMNEADWVARGHVPALVEYLENGSASVALWPLFAIGALLLGDPDTDNNTDYDIVPELHRWCAVGARIHNDIHDFESGKDNNGAVSAAECLMKVGGISREEALRRLRQMMMESIREVTKVYLKPVQSSEGKAWPNTKAMRLAFEVTRSVHFLYHHTDGFSVCNGSVKDQIHTMLFDPIPVPSDWDWLGCDKAQQHEVGIPIS